MKFHFLISTIAILCMSSGLLAQHTGHAGDVEFGYDNLASPTAFDIEEPEVTSEGFLFFESEMEELDPFTPGDFSSDEPGFTTNSAEGRLVNENDQIWLRVVDAAINSTHGVGFVNYFNPTTGMLEASGRLGVYDNSATSIDLILNGNMIESGDNPQFLGLGDDHGDVHDHLIIDLLDDATAPIGAYGVMFQLQSDLSTADGTMDLSSDPFWIVWNHGMSESDFESNAVPSFGIASVPEPGSAVVLAMTLGFLTSRRKRSVLGRQPRAS